MKTTSLLLRVEKFWITKPLKFHFSLPKTIEICATIRSDVMKARLVAVEQFDIDCCSVCAVDHSALERVLLRNKVLRRVVQRQQSSTYETIDRI
jgi:hypothetical protein